MSSNLPLHSKGRAIDYLRISLTPECNLACSYCKGQSRPQTSPVLTVAEIHAVVKAALPLGITKYRLTGGEPLLRPRECLELIALLRSEPAVSNVSLTTNGVLLERYASALKAAGLKRINISLDTLNPEKFAALTRSGLFPQVWRGIQAALTEGFNPVRLNVVLMRHTNFDEVADFVRLTADKRLQIRFIELMPALANQAGYQEEFISADLLRERLQARFTLEPTAGATSTGPATYYSVAGYGTIGIIAPVSACFCGQCNRLRLSSDGKLRPCLFSAAAVDIRPFITRPQELQAKIQQAVAIKPAGMEESQLTNMAAIGG